VPNRHGSSNSYRYGFQGQEKDDELKGEGNSLNYTYRMHDPRVGRFFATDPLEKKYPFYSPYAFSGNRVIDAVEIEGLEPMGVDIIMTMAKFWIKSKLGLQNNVNSMMGPVTKNNETINNNILLDEKAKEFYYKADAIAGASSISGKIFVAGGVTSGVVVGGGAVFAETSLLSAAGATLNTELGYLASSGPLWVPTIQSNIGTISVMSAGTTFMGQMYSNDFKFDENINFAQPVFASFTKYPIASNIGESSINIYFQKEQFHFKLNDSNTFLSTYFSNFVGGQIGGKLEVNTGYTPADNALNIVTGTGAELIENVIGDKSKKVLDSVKVPKKQFKKEPVSNKKVKDNISTGSVSRIRIDLIKIKS
jgi:RHS repeat-associated protein